MSIVPVYITRRLGFMVKLLDCVEVEELEPAGPTIYKIPDEQRIIQALALWRIGTRPWLERDEITMIHVEALQLSLTQFNDLLGLAPELLMSWRNLAFPIYRILERTLRHGIASLFYENNPGITYAPKHITRLDFQEMPPGWKNDITLSLTRIRWKQNNQAPTWVWTISDVESKPESRFNLNIEKL